MRGVLLTAAALIVTATASAANGPPVLRILPASGMTVAASTNAAGADNVMLALTIRYVMQCGYPGAGPLVITLPAAEVVPSSLPKGSVLVGGVPAAAKISGRSVAVAIPKYKGFICDVMGPGKLQVIFTSRAGLGNPPTPGSYHYTAVHARRTFGAALTIS
jgi:hypothetical protein